MGKGQARKSRSRSPATGRDSAPFLLEIGTEELPYQFIPPTLRALAQSGERLLKEHRLTFGSVRTFATPRRLVLLVQSLSSRQAPAVKEAMGPSRAVAFDSAGRPTKAAVGFATSHGIAVNDLEVRDTAKGEYVFAVKRESGRPATEILAECIPLLIGEISFPKSMRWNVTGVRFARPIRWLMALYGKQVVRTEFGGLQTSNRTWGHRFMGPAGARRSQGIAMADVDVYLKSMERYSVMPDQDHRRTLILAQLKSLATSARGHVQADDDLLEQAIFSVESPHAILGSFNPAYLSLPKDVLVTAMKEHQGYFSLTRPDGQLLPRFIAVTNMKRSDMLLIRRGNERVLAARLADAQFFFAEDRKRPLEDRVEKLKAVVFHQKLGTLHQKTERVASLVTFLAQLVGDDQVVGACRRAAILSKADLLTGIVGEFPSLQGVMGAEYATHDGETAEVSRAVGEQYLPRSMDGPIPQTVAGQLLSLADRLDSIVAFFLVGIVPTGSEDPLGLRRHATAAVRILVEGNLRLRLSDALTHARGMLNTQGFAASPLTPNTDRQRNEVVDPLEFILERLRYYGRTVHGLREDVMAAVLNGASNGPGDLVDLLARMKALQAIATRPEFDPLMVGFKRAHRLVEKEQWTREEIDPSLFEHESEGMLHNMLKEARDRLPDRLKNGQYGEALECFVRMKPAIDGFFVGVLVNTDDQARRANRLSLLCAVDRLFMSFGDFSQIVVQGT